MQQRAVIDGKESNHDEQDEDGDACVHGVRGQVPPPRIGGHPSGEDNQAKPGAGEGHDRTHHVRSSLGWNTIHHQPRNDATLERLSVGHVPPGMVARSAIERRPGSASSFS